MTWYAFQLKDTYNRITQYGELLNLLRNYYKKKPEDIFIAGNGKKENGICNYIFIKEDEANIGRFWGNLSQEKFFISAMGYVPIPENEFIALRQDFEEKEKITVRYGDIIQVANGPYRKLWGIVLQVKEDNSYDVGFNFCAKSLIINLKPEQIKVVKSLFEIWKFRR